MEIRGWKQSSAKTYLSKIRLLDLKIKQLIEERDSLIALAGGLRSKPLDPDPVQTSISGDTMSLTVARYLDLEAELNEDIDLYVHTKDRIIHQIHDLEDPRYVELLHLRYVKYLRLEEIACVMVRTDGRPYSYVHIRRLHGKALQEFQKKHMV